MKNKINFFYVPCKNKKEANTMAKSCIENNLAACANIFPIQSIYPWKNKIESAKEHVLILKTLPSLSKKLSQNITKVHSYSTPCIAITEFKVNKVYYQWLEKQVLKA